MTSPALFRVRSARGHDLAALSSIEQRAAQRFVDSPYPQMATFPLSDSRELAMLVEAGSVVVATDDAGAPVGFAAVGNVGPEPYLHEMDVEPSWSGRGVGRALLRAVAQYCRVRGHRTLLLTTFADVPWNGPFYERVGFVVVERSLYDAELLALSDRERAVGLPMGSRVIMRADLDAPGFA